MSYTPFGKNSTPDTDHNRLVRIETKLSDFLIKFDNVMSTIMEELSDIRGQLDDWEAGETHEPSQPRDAVPEDWHDG